MCFFRLQFHIFKTESKFDRTSWILFVRNYFIILNTFLYNCRLPIQFEYKQAKCLWKCHHGKCFRTSGANFTRLISMTKKNQTKKLKLDYQNMWNRRPSWKYCSNLNKAPLSLFQKLIIVNNHQNLLNFIYYVMLNCETSRAIEVNWLVAIVPLEFFFLEIKKFS